MKFSTSHRENNLAEKNLKTEGAILKLTMEMDTSVRHQLTLTFVIKH